MLWSSPKLAHCYTAARPRDKLSCRASDSCQLMASQGVKSTVANPAHYYLANRLQDSLFLCRISKQHNY
jgi:hypothetical protein